MYDDELSGRNISDNFDIMSITAFTGKDIKKSLLKI